MQIDRTIAKGQLVPLTFMLDSVAASQSDVQLPIAAVTSDAANQVDGYAMPFAGEVVAVSYVISATSAASTLTVGPTVNGTEKTALTLTAPASTSALSGHGHTARETIRFAAGDLVGAEYTTTSSWTGTTADLVVTVWTLLYVEGI